MSRVLITTDYLTPGDEVDRLLRDAGHETSHRPMIGKRDPEELVEALVGVDGALIANELMGATVLERATSLKAVVRTGVGYDSIDVAAAAHLGITVSNLPGINANAVAEYTLGLLLSAARRLAQSAQGVAAGEWPRKDGSELRGSTLGLVGYGYAARAIVPLANAFGMDVLITTSFTPADNAEPGATFVDLPELLSRSDYVSLHMSLTERSRGLIGAEQFKLMKPTAILVNTARGPMVDETALFDAVRTGRIAGAALDVVCEEPLPIDSPLRALGEVVVYSHMAGQSEQARRQAALEGARELIAALEGSPRFAIVTPEAPRAVGVHS